MGLTWNQRRIVHRSSRFRTRYRFGYFEIRTGQGTGQDMSRFEHLDVQQSQSLLAAEHFVEDRGASSMDEREVW